MIIPGDWGDEPADEAEPAGEAEPAAEPAAVSNAITASEVDGESALDDDDLGDLSFDPEEGHDPGQVLCTACQATIEAEYYEADGQLVCAGCAHVLRHGGADDSKAGRAVRSSGLGCLAAGVGALLWYGVAAVTGYEIGLIAIAVGFVVGFAVRHGSRGMGGRFYQALAMILTYVAIVSTYVPPLVEAMMLPVGADDVDPFATEAESPVVAESPVAESPVAGEEGGMPFIVALIVALIVAPFAPFLMGFENLIGIALIGFALWEAWRINRRRVKNIAGPFSLSAGPGLPPG